MARKKGLEWVQLAGDPGEFAGVDGRHGEVFYHVRPNGRRWLLEYRVPGRLSRWRRIGTPTGREMKTKIAAKRRAVLTDEHVRGMSAEAFEMFRLGWMPPGWK